MKKNSELALVRQNAVLTLLKMYKKANAGHIGSSLSCIEILIDIVKNRLQEKDEIILSKGHAAAALYVALSLVNRIDPALLDDFYKDGTLLAAHPPCSGKIPSIPFGTGSLGHGLSLATGLALSTKFTKKAKKIFCVLSDGDCNEGSTWEAALFCSHHNLSNLVVIVDANGLQGIGQSSKILNLEPLGEKFKNFGFDVVEIKNGNSFDEIDSAFNSFKSESIKPKCIIARTIKGHGISFMENKVEWHYLPMTDELYEMTVNETLNGIEK